ncbi:hypothetical protein [Streptomyces sp. NPDC059743]|uniref:hypothetical protein n=1 Tax=Streptomyces sp. NPDC059743 TaxID=3346928 RepID=UPI00365F15BF
MPASPTAQATPDAPRRDARETLRATSAADEADPAGGGLAASDTRSLAERAVEPAAGLPPHRAAGSRTERSRAPHGEPCREPVADTARAPSGDPAGEVVRWASLSCLLVPVVLTVYGTSFGGTIATTLGLAAVTAVCRLLLRRSERSAAQLRAEEAKMGERPRRGVGARTEAGAEGRAGARRRARGRTRNEVRMYGTYGTSGSRRSSGGRGARRSSRTREGSAPGD